MSDWEVTTVEAAVSLLRRGTAPVYVSESPVLAIGQRCVRNGGFDEFAARPHSSAIPVVVEPQPGDVLLNSTGTGTIGRSCVFPELQGKFMIDGHVTVLRSRPEVAVGSVLNEFLRSSEGQRLLESRCFTGSTNQVELSRAQLGKLTFNMPPVEEQRRIAEILDTIDETVQATERVIAKLELIRDGRRRAVLSAQIAECHSSQFGEQFAMILGKMMSPAALVGRNPSPFLANRNVQWERFVLNDLDRMDFSEHEKHKFALKSGDLLVCEGGEVGRAAVWQAGQADTFFQKAIHRLRPVGSVSSEYAVQYLRHASESGIFAKFTSQTSIAHLTGEQLSRMPIPVPTHEFQQLLIGELSTLRTTIELERANLEKFRNTRSGLAADLLSSRVRTVAS